jgi:hypothetical protein
MSNKLLLNHGVITSGAGRERVVLCYDSGLVYQYQDPSNVLAMYQSGLGWIVLDAPSYRSGGWGRPSTGDFSGSKLIENTHSVLRSIGAKRYKVNSKTWMTRLEITRLNREIKKSNDLVKRQNEIAKKLNREETHDFSEIESIKITPLDGRYGEKEKLENGLKGLDAIKTAKGYESAIKVFLEQKGKTTKIDTYTVSKNEVHQGDKIVAFRDAQGVVFMNSEVLSTTNFEREFMGNQSIIQSMIREIAKYSIPFNVLKAGDLKLEETKVLEQGPESTHEIKVNRYDSKLVTRHFTGALLLENNGRKFLMDIDREEIKHKLFNAFFVEVDKSVTSIEGAYESMKPESVKQAERDGKKVKRQGEWFFVETGKELKILSSDILQWDRDNQQKIVKRFNVSHGKGRPNSLYKPVGFGDLDKLVCGTVSHSGREHADLDLGTEEITSSGNGDYTTFQLWELVPNSTIANFTVEGDID